jgi:hypothetical protein
MAVKFYCTDEDGVMGCGAVLRIVKELPSPAAQVNYFEAVCTECKARWEVGHDMESDEVSASVLEAS